MARPVSPLTVRLAFIASVALAGILLLLLMIGSYLRWFGCWACGW